MIINRLSVLLAERTIRANKLALETGIAQSTLTRITNNRSSQIDYDTLNKICNYFKISPNDFFDYTPFDFKVSYSLLEQELSIFITVSRYNERYKILELTPNLSIKTGIDAVSGYPDNTQDIISIQFPKNQIPFYGYLASSIGEEEDKIISAAISQKVLDDVNQAMNEFVLNYYEQEFKDFAQDYLSILEPNQVQKEAKEKEEEISSRLETNLTLF